MKKFYQVQVYGKIDGMGVDGKWSPVPSIIKDLANAEWTAEFYREALWNDNNYSQQEANKLVRIVEISHTEWLWNKMRPFWLFGSYVVRDTGRGVQRRCSWAFDFESEIGVAHKDIFEFRAYPFSSDGHKK